MGTLLPIISNEPYSTKRITVSFPSVTPLDTASFSSMDEFLRTSSPEISLSIQMEETRSNSPILSLKKKRHSSPDSPTQRKKWKMEPEVTTMFNCRWGNCIETFSTRTGVATHCSDHIVPNHDIHSKKKSAIHICQWNGCGEYFTDLKQLAKHLAEETHIGQTPFLSKMLTESIEQSNKMKKRKVYICSFPLCGKTFSDSSNKKVNNLFNLMIHFHF
jgi:hypothetical protein